MDHISLKKAKSLKLQADGKRTGILRWFGYTDEAIKQEMDRPTYFNMLKANPEKARARVVQRYGDLADSLIAEWTTPKKAS